jgi:hypothetical protein
MGHYGPGCELAFLTGDNEARKRQEGVMVDGLDHVLVESGFAGSMAVVFAAPAGQGHQHQTGDTGERCPIRDR